MVFANVRTSTGYSIHLREDGELLSVFGDDGHTTAHMFTFNRDDIIAIAESWLDAMSPGGPYIIAIHREVGRWARVGFAANIADAVALRDSTKRMHPDSDVHIEIDGNILP